MPGPPARLRRRASIVVALAAAVLAITGCTSSSGSGQTSDPGGPLPQDQLASFVGDWIRQDFAKAAVLTSKPGEAQLLLQSVTDNLNPGDLQITAGTWARPAADAATVPVTFTWDLPKAGTWTYQATWSWHRQGTGDQARWTLDWGPTVVHPQLGAGQSVAVRTTDTTGGSLVDRNNSPILSPITVYSVLLSPPKVDDLPATAARLAGVLTRFDPTITAASIIEGAGKSDPKVGYTVVNLREADFDTVRTQLTGIAGVSTPNQIRNLPPTRGFAQQVLAQVEPIADTMSQGKAGWRVVAIDSAGEEVTTLEEQAPVEGPKITLTLDIPTQTAAEAALAKISEPAVLVAIQPSTGEILAVAQNAPADAQGPIALTGQYPPGSTFKIVTATAAFDRGVTTPSAQVQCPGTLTIDSRPIRNEFEFDLGTVTTTIAFAKSCNTTFAQLASQMPADALPAAAREYGIGLDFVIKGITTLTGKVPQADSVVQAAENGFGQGVVLMTPFAAALMAATAAGGDMPIPTLIRGTKTTVDQQAPARKPASAAGIRTVMRAVVTEGTAQNLGDVGTVSAKTGTAEFTDDKGKLKAHAWTVGFRGDLAFATLIVGGDDSKRTNVVAHDFLAAVPVT